MAPGCGSIGNYTDSTNLLLPPVPLPSKEPSVVMPYCVVGASFSPDGCWWVLPAAVARVCWRLGATAWVQAGPMAWAWVVGVLGAG